MPRLWFVVPVHGRLSLAEICLRQLRRTCDSLIAEGVQACAVVVSSPEELREIQPVSRLGFAAVARNNEFLGRRFNDGMQLACDPRYNPAPADYVVPCGSDDWVDYRLFLNLPAPDTVVGFQRLSFVNEDATEISSTFLNYRGGAGIRIIPRQLLEPLNYRPAEEDRKRACDTSILTSLSVFHGHGLKVAHPVSDPRQIVDWKTPAVQLNPYQSVTTQHRGEKACDPFAELADFYPAEALDEMREFYAEVGSTDLVAA